MRGAVPKVSQISACTRVQLDLVSKTKGVVVAEAFFSGHPPPAKNKNTYGALLNCYCKELMKDRALSYFDKMGYVASLAFNNTVVWSLASAQPVFSLLLLTTVQSCLLVFINVALIGYIL
ncbi:hypothetical protein V8G54_004818 [Vigna mungo]|uniref:Uncharacterized protein n=1 Tax=Vigna mungo TaxID=3915 RepID=A0AAQ3SBH6_VIGMU